MRNLRLTGNRKFTGLDSPMSLEELYAMNNGTADEFVGGTMGAPMMPMPKLTLADGIGGTAGVGGVSGAAAGAGAGGALGKVAGVAAKANPYYAYGTLALGGLQALGGLAYSLGEGSKPMPEFAATPETNQSFSEASRMARMGFTPEQKGAFGARLGTQTATNFRNATEVGGGGMAKTIGASLRGQNLEGLNQFAVNDANLRQSNIRYRDNIARTFQSIADRNVQNRIQRRIMTDQAFGRAGSSGLTNLAGYWNLGSALSSI